MVSIRLQDFGAVGDGVTDDTLAFHRAISELGRIGGGTLIVNGGDLLSPIHYRSLPIALVSNMIFLIEKGVTISAINDESRWPMHDPYPSYAAKGDYQQAQGFLGGTDIKNVTIVGQGKKSIVNGYGDYWWKQVREKTLQHQPPHLIQFTNAQDIRIRNLKLVDSPAWNVHLYTCDRAQ